MTKMRTPESSTNLTLFHSNVRDSDGKEFVLSCGYNADGKFGYFFCKQQLHVQDQPYRYSDVQSFYPKVNEKSYGQALDDMKARLLLD